MEYTLCMWTAGAMCMWWDTINHALWGWDTTSKVFSIGKGTALKKNSNSECFQEDILLFLEKDVSKAEIKEAGQRLLVSYWSNRLYKLHQKVAWSNKVVQLEYLRPT